MGGGGVAPRPSPLSECGGGESIGPRGHVSNTRIGWRASRARRPLLPSWGPVSEGSGGRTGAEGSAGPRPASRVPARPNAAASLGPGLLAAGADPLPPTPLLTGSAWLPRPGTWHCAGARVRPGGGGAGPAAAGAAERRRPRRRGGARGGWGASGSGRRGLSPPPLLSPPPPCPAPRGLEALLGLPCPAPRGNARPGSQWRRAGPAWVRGVRMGGWAAPRAWTAGQGLGHPWCPPRGHEKPLRCGRFVSTFDLRSFAASRLP